VCFLGELNSLWSHPIPTFAWNAMKSHLPEGGESSFRSRLSCVGVDATGLRLPFFKVALHLTGWGSGGMEL
jgi:hypothetical protein